MIDVEPYQKYFTGKNPDLLGYTIIGIAASLKQYYPDAPKPPPEEAFKKIARVCDELDENTFIEISSWAFRTFYASHLTKLNQGWFEIARRIELKSREESQAASKRTSQGSPQPAIEETSPSEEFKAPPPEHISTIIPRTFVPPQETPEETKPELRLVKKPFSLKIAMRLCADWRLDPRWEKLCACAKLLFYWLVFRTYRKDTILRIKKALANGETYFPWCLTGIKSLSKQLTYLSSSSKKVNHYEDRQIRRALRQLWDLGFIHRIFRGYEDQGAGKYHVFLNPKMSATFNQARVKTKQGITPKKRHSRMS